jgi:urease accessory protein
MDSVLLIVAAPDRLPRIECRGGLTARSTLADTVHLVSAAATPLGGDNVAIRVIVEAGARLRLRSVAATVALPGPRTATSHSVVTLDVAGHLDLDLEPTIVAAQARHHSAVRAAIEEAGALRLRERVQIGRTGEGQGFWSGSMHADVKGRPLLRHRIELGPGAVTEDLLGAPRAVVSELCYPDDESAEHPGTVLHLADGGVLSTWQGERLGPNYARSAV